MKKSIQALIGVLLLTLTTTPRIQDHLRTRHPASSGLLLAFPAAVMIGSSAMAAEIHDTVLKGDAAAVTRLLKQNPKLANLVDEEKGTTPLYEAVDAGNLEVVKFLLKAGAKVNAKTDDGMTPVLRAAAIASPDGMVGMARVLWPFLNSGPGRARTKSREALKTFRQSVSLPPAEEESRLAILALLVEGGACMADTIPDTLWTPLHMAAAFPNRKAAEYLLDHGADPEVSARGLRPLHLALLSGNVEVAKLLITRKVDVNAPLPNGARPLHYAVSVDIDAARLLLDHGAEVNAVGKAGAPALHGATWSDDIFNLLLERGADPKLQRADGTTTLHMACQDGSAALVGKLLQLHPDVNAWDGRYFTPLLNAAEVGRVDLLKLLVGAGANLKATEDHGHSALHLAAASPNPEAVQYLLDQKLGVNAMSDSGLTPLMNAAEYGRLATVILLLRAGAAVNGAERTHGMTPLMFAARGPAKPPPDWQPGGPVTMDCGPVADYQQIAALLLENGATLKARDGTGMPALHWAAMSGNVAMVELLLSKGAEVNTKDNNGASALHGGAVVGNAAVVELLISKGAEVDAKDSRLGRTPLHAATYAADAKTVAVLLANGARISAADNNKLQPIHCAAQGHSVEVIELLLAKGAAVAVKESHGATPLHLAVIAGQPKVVRVLLAHDAPPAALDDYKRSPLHFAAEHGLVEIVRLLLDHRAPVNVADWQGDTPLHLAAMVRVDKNDIKTTQGEPVDPGADPTLAAINKSKPADKLTIVRLLLAKGASPKAKNLAGATPIDVAAKFGTPEILALIKSGKTTSSGK